MEKKQQRCLLLAVICLAAFVLWTVLVCTVDREAIGPNDSRVGLAALNGWVHHVIGVNMTWYTITDWLSLLPVGCAAGFALLGLVQWIRRKHIFRVDRSILVLGALFVAMAAVYLFFEWAAINYRPVLIECVLEISYPSSTTLLVLCIMIPAMMQLRRRITNVSLRKWVLLLMAVFTAMMVIGRILSGVHWFSDIVGSVLISQSLIMLYAVFDDQ